MQDHSIPDVGSDARQPIEAANTHKSMLEAALEYAANGWWVFPVPPGEKKSYKAAKYSSTKWGMTTNPKIIRQDFRKWPDANVGIVTGAKSGIFVIEADTTEGHDVDGLASIQNLESRYGVLPETRTAISPSGSIHRYYRHPGDGIKIWNSESFLAPGVDVRGDGGMVLAPPSIKPDVGTYRWLNQGEVVDAPEWLIAEARLRPADAKKDKKQDAHASDDGSDNVTPNDAAPDRDDHDLEADPHLIASALDDIPNDNVSWGDWNRVAMAAYRATDGSAVAFAAFDKWSRKSCKYDATNTWKKWDALRGCPPNSIGAGTIFHMAMQARKATPNSGKQQQAHQQNGGSATSDDMNAKDFAAKEGEEREVNQAPVADDLPIMQIHTRISALATETQTLLIDSGVPFYARSGELVRPIVRTVQAAHGTLTRTGQLKLVSATYLRDTMCRHAIWHRYDERKRKWARTTAPINVAETLLERDGVWGFPEILGVIATPTMRPDGTLLIQKGYDAATRLLLIEPPLMPTIPDHPTPEDALTSLALLERLICESPFVDQVSRSVALSGLITPVVRGAFPVAPMHVASAPVAGSGKSHLWDMAAAISSGQQRMPVIAAGNEEETEKRLAGVMLTGQPLVSIDNVNGELKGDFLCQAIEQHFLDVRPLGRSNIVRIATGGVSFYATGNNIIIVGDLCRRTITSRLDAKLENPQLRQFKNDPVRDILSNRGAYIAACLTICRAYIVAGRPNPAPRLASFAGWSDTVRSALIWLGEADPVDSMAETRAEDPQRAVLSDLLHAWSKDHGTGKGSDVPLAVIMEKALMLEKMGGYETGQFKHPELNAAVRAATLEIGASSPGAKVDQWRFGQYCKRHKGRIVDGLRLANQPSNRGGAATWWVEEVADE